MDAVCALAVVDAQRQDLARFMNSFGRVAALTGRVPLSDTPEVTCLFVYVQDAIGKAGGGLS